MDLQTEKYNGSNIMSEKFELIMPYGAKTHNSVALVWGKLKDTDTYDVYINGKIAKALNKTSITFENLLPDTEYSFAVKSGDEVTNEITVKTKPMPQIYNVCDYGALGDNKTVNTKAIQAAIDDCKDGGMVYIPEGVFISGAVFLHGNMTFCVDGKLLGSSDASDYPVFTYRFEGREEKCYASLVNTPIENAPLSDITICGHGVIDGNGKKLCPNQLAKNLGTRGRTVCIRNTENLYLKDITIRNAPAWCTHIIYCNKVSVNNVSVYSKKDENGVPYDLVNGDGLDPDSTKNMYIFDSMIESEDDCIAIKSGRDEEGRKVGISSENIYIMNTTLSCGFGVAMGSEVSGGVKNVLVRDCVFKDTYSVGSVKSPRGRGAVIENIRYSNCKHYYKSGEFSDCEWFRGAIYVDNFYSNITFDPSCKMPVNEGTPKIKNVIFEDIEVDTVAGNAIYLTGLPESPLENICLKNVTAHGKFGLKAYNIDGLKMENVSVKSDEDGDWYLKNIE